MVRRYRIVTSFRKRGKFRTAARDNNTYEILIPELISYVTVLQADKLHQGPGTGPNIEWDVIFQTGLESLNCNITFYRLGQSVQEVSYV